MVLSPPWELFVEVTLLVIGHLFCLLPVQYLYASTCQGLLSLAIATAWLNQKVEFLEGLLL